MSSSGRGRGRGRSVLLAVRAHDPSAEAPSTVLNHMYNCRSQASKQLEPEMQPRRVPQGYQNLNPMVNALCN